MKKTIRDYDIKHKKVIIRVDFNVPMENQKITDMSRIIQSVETIKYACKEEAKIILLSHLGRVKTEADKEKNTLKPVAEALSKVLKQPVLFVPTTRGPLLETAISNMKDGDIVLIENTRFEDLDGKKESGNDPALGAYWASLGDIYINDAFGTVHRNHASNVGIASHLPSGIGFLIEKELKYMLPILSSPDHPFTVILGGSKVSDKIGVIQNIIDKADYILIGGAMAYTFLKAEGHEVGNSLVEEEFLTYCKELLQKHDSKIVLPVDSINQIDHEIVCQTIETFGKNATGFDIGPETVETFQKYLKISETIVWNGPLGMFEKEAFSKGTEAIGKTISQTNAFTIIGGGDTAAAVSQIDVGKQAHISTGGGASLALLEGQKLPGIEAIDDER